jgi:hypothetical protein
MKTTLIILLFALSACHMTMHMPCDIIAVPDSLTGRRSITTSSALIEMDGTAMHDTVAVDFVVKVVDFVSGKPVPNALVEIENVEGKKTNLQGGADFIAFHNDGGSFTIKLSHPAYGCLELQQMKFLSGQVIQAIARLKKHS